MVAPKYLQKIHFDNFHVLKIQKIGVGKISNRKKKYNFFLLQNSSKEQHYFFLSFN